MTRGKKMILIKIIVIIAVLLIGFVVWGFIRGARLVEDMTHLATNERTSDKVLTDWLVNDKGFDIEGFRSEYRIEEICIESSLDGHKIPASYIYAKEDKTAGTVIMVHGLLGNRLSNYPMAQLFLENGFNVITYDQRASGGNTAGTTTHGYLESYDAVDYVRYAAQSAGQESVIGVWGQSMGAATLENALDTEDFKERVDFVVLDSPLGNMADVIGERGFLGDISRFFGSIVSNFKNGFFFSEQAVYDNLKNTQIPIFVAATERDRAIPYKIQESIYNAIGSEQKYLYNADSDHSNAYFDHPDEYAQKLNEFLSRIKIN